jgi:hypothetical protein
MKSKNPKLSDKIKVHIESIQEKISALSVEEKYDWLVDSLIAIPQKKDSDFEEHLFQFKSTSHQKRELFDVLEIDWLYRSFLFPELILESQIIIKAIGKEITNHIDTISVFLDRRNLQNLISPQLFYEKIFCNQYINTYDKVDAVCDILTVANSLPKALDNIIELIYRYKYSPTYKPALKKCINNIKKVDVTWVDRRILYEANKLDANYTGELTLPANCRLICSWIDIRREGLDKEEIINQFWEIIVSRVGFVIHMSEPEFITFLIQPFRDIDWFHIYQVSYKENEVPSSKTMSLMADYINKEQNQLFFKENQCKDIHYKSSGFISDIDKLLATL